MNIDVIPGQDSVVVSLQGRLDATTSALLEARLRALCDEGHAQFVLGCEQLHYISSAGLKILMSVRKRLEQLPGGGAIRLAAARPHVLDVFRLSGLDALFAAHESVEAALSARAAA